MMTSRENDLLKLSADCMPSTSADNTNLYFDNNDILDVMLNLIQ